MAGPFTYRATFVGQILDPLHAAGFRFAQGATVNGVAGLCPIPVVHELYPLEPEHVAIAEWLDRGGPA